MPSKFVSNYAEDLLKKFGDSFTTDFQKNKELLKKMDPSLTKTQRNQIAGLIVRWLKRMKKEE